MLNVVITTLVTPMCVLTVQVRTEGTSYFDYSNYGWS